MVYANRITKEMYVFDKDGEWHDEGVYHDALSMDKTYNETNWYDEFSVHKPMINCTIITARLETIIYRPITFSS